MDTAIKIARESMLLTEKLQEIISHNVANINTEYFKEKDIFFIKQNNQIIPQYFLNLENGAVIKSGNNLDICLPQNAFLKITDGKEHYFIKDGRLHINNKGELMYKHYYVLNDNEQNIYIRDINNLFIDNEGYIYQDGKKTDRFGIYKLELDKNANFESNLFKSAKSEKINDINSLIQGARESSNVNRVKQLVKMINALHIYEACQKVTIANDEIISKTIQENLKF